MEKYHNKDHLERKENEVFVGNTNAHGFENIGWTEKRAGEKAFYEEIGEKGNGIVGGVPYKNPDYFPVFVLTEEVRSQSPEIYLRLRSSADAAKDKAAEEAKAAQKKPNREKAA